MDNTLSRYGDAVRRAVVTHDPSAFPAMVASEEKAEVTVAYRAFCDLGVGLPCWNDISSGAVGWCSMLS